MAELIGIWGSRVVDGNCVCWCNDAEEGFVFISCNDFDNDVDYGFVFIECSNDEDY
jgi:hypothetical protein